MMIYVFKSEWQRMKQENRKALALLQRAIVKGWKPNDNQDVVRRIVESEIGDDGAAPVEPTDTDVSEYEPIATENLELCRLGVNPLTVRQPFSLRKS